MMDMLLKEDLLGKVVAYVWVVEFQKRGKPHIHLLLSLAHEDKFRTKERVDMYFSAEIPDKDKCPRLHKLVTKFMVHGPCTDALCKKNGFCTKRFPKPFVLETTFDQQGNCHCRRRCHPAEPHRSRSGGILNSDIVMYCPILTLTFESHINTEVISDSIRAIKYIFKYIYKGHDVASLSILKDGVLNYDEPANFVSGRYVGSCEAHWMLSSLPMHGRSHTVIRLPVHLENVPEKDVVFEDGLETIAEKEDETLVTMQDAFFRICQHPIRPDFSDVSLADSEVMMEQIRLWNIAKDLLYSEVVKHFLYNKPARKWQARVKGGDKVCSRIRDVGPYNRELFAMRMLLLHVKGPTCFADLRTFNREVYENFTACAIARNLIRDDDCYYKLFDDYIAFKSPKQLRDLFAILLMRDIIVGAEKWWQKYRDVMSEDFMMMDAYKNGTSSDWHNLALHELERVFLQNRVRCVKFGLPAPDCKKGSAHVWPKKTAIPRVFLNAQDPTKIVLNRDQELVRELINKAVDGTSDTKLIAVIGPGGSGKTTCYRRAIADCKSRGKTALCFATTGIAATMLEGGMTAHRGFGLPIKLDRASKSMLETDSAQANSLREAAVLMIDEISMLSTHALTVIDRLLREIMRKPFDPFGGKVMVLGGDFRQLLPVVRAGNRTTIMEVCVVSNPLWPLFKTVILSKNMRAEGDVEFCDWLLKVGTGQVPLTEGNTNPNIVEIPKEMLLKVPATNPPTSAMEAMINEVFGKDIENLTVAELSKSAILASTNVEVLKMNNYIIDKIQEPAFTYLSLDAVISDDPNDKANISVETLNSITPSGLPPHSITLKKGSIILLLRNIRPEAGLCNGTRMQVTRLGINSIEAQIISESHHGDVHFLPMMELISDDNRLPCSMSRLQFPVIPAYAMTINKSQGQTFDRVGIYLNNAVFAHGQLYVALSRATSKKHLKVFIRQCNQQQGELFTPGHFFTPNIVYREVFRHGEMAPRVKDLEELDPDLANCLKKHIDEMDDLIEKDMELQENNPEREWNKLPPLECIQDHDQLDPQQIAPVIVPMGEGEEHFDDDEDEQYELPQKSVGEREKQIKDFVGLPYVILSNSMSIVDNDYFPILLTNQCARNCVAHGLIFLIKTDPVAGALIRSMAQFIEYYDILVQLVDKPSRGVHQLWGGFSHMKAPGNRTSSGVYDMSGDVTELLEKLNPDHISFRVGSNILRSVTFGMRDGDVFDFPDALNNIMTHHSRRKHPVIYEDLIFVAPGSPNVAINSIPLAFEHHNEGQNYIDQYSFKFAVHFCPPATAGGMGHYLTYAYEKQRNRWWRLCDIVGKEEIFQNLREKINVSLLAYGKD